MVNYAELITKSGKRLGCQSVEGSDRRREASAPAMERARKCVLRNVWIKYGAICYAAGSYGPAPSICGRTPASMGAANSSTAGEAGAQPVRFRKASQVLVDGDLAMGAGATEAASGLPDCDGKDGGTKGRLVFLENGGHQPE